MSAHIIVNKLAMLSPADMAALLERSNLSKIDRIIAVERYNHSTTLVDIGAMVNMDRSTISYRLRKVIEPRLLYMLGE